MHKQGGSSRIKNCQATSRRQRQRQRRQRHQRCVCLFAVLPAPVCLTRARECVCACLCVFACLIHVCACLRSCVLRACACPAVPVCCPCLSLPAFFAACVSASASAYPRRFRCLGIRGGAAVVRFLQQRQDKSQKQKKKKNTNVNFYCAAQVRCPGQKWKLIYCTKSNK